MLLGSRKRKHGLPRSDHLGSIIRISRWIENLDTRPGFWFARLASPSLSTLLYTGNTYFYAFHRILISTHLDMYFPIHPFWTWWGPKHRSSEEVSRYRNGCSTEAHLILIETLLILTITSTILWQFTYWYHTNHISGLMAHHCTRNIWAPAGVPQVWQLWVFFIRSRVVPW